MRVVLVQQACSSQRHLLLVFGEAVDLAAMEVRLGSASPRVRDRLIHLKNIKIHNDWGSDKTVINTNTYLDVLIISDRLLRLRSGLLALVLPPFRLRRALFGLFLADGVG